MAGIPFLHNIDLNDNQLLNAKLHTSGTAPSNPGTGTIWYDSDNSLVKIYNSGWTSIAGDITAVTSATTGQLTVASGTGPAPALTIVTAAIANGGSGLATADQIHTFVTGQTDAIAASTSGTAAIATAVTVADESSDTTCFPLFATAATGNLGPKSGSNLTFNSATGILTATGFAGPLTGAVTGNADTATKIASITNSNIVQLTTTQTLTNKTLTAPILTAPVLGTPASGVATNITGLPAANVLQGTMVSGMVLVAPALGTPASGNLANCTFPTANINVNDDVSVANLKTALAGGFGSNAVTIGDSDDLVTIGNDLTVTGDLIVSGDTVTVNTATLDVEDLNITVGKAATSSSAANGAGLTFGAWSSGTIPTLTWVHASTYLAVNKNFHVTGNITLSGTVDGIDIATDVAANTLKNTHVATNIGASANSSTLEITSSTGSNASVPAATTSAWGAMTDEQVTALNAAQTSANVGTLIDARSSAHTITGDNSATSFTITYGFTAAAVNDVIIQVICSYASDTDHDGDTVYTETERHSTTQCKIKFATAPATGHTYRVLCFKIA